MEEKTKRVPPGNKKIEFTSFDDCVKQVRRAVERQQTYTQSMEPAIQMAGGAYHVYLKTMASIAKRKKVTYPVLTREGSTAHKLYPDIEYLPAATRALQLSLKSLGLTLETLTQSDDDPLDRLAAKVNGELDG